MDFTQYLLLGLATSVHCVAMCGGLVMTYSVRQDAPGGLAPRLAPHLAYQGAKILSYMTVAVLLGSFAALAGSVVDITGFRNWVMVGAGAFMVLLGLGMTGYFPWLLRLTPKPPEWLVTRLARTRKKAMAEAKAGGVHLATPVTFGLLTGLMPCAPLIAAQAGAMSVASPVRGAVLMLGFGLGTAPLMLLIGLVSGFLGAKARARMQIVAAIAVLVFGLVILDRGLMLVGSPVTFDAVKRAVVGAPAGTATSSGESTGTVRFDLVIEGTRFVPDVVVLPADRSVEIVVDRREDTACSDQLAIPQLGILVDLAPFAKTTVKVPPTKAGEYTLTCGMGMMSGRIVFGGPSATGPPIALMALAVLLLAVAVWAVLRARSLGSATPGEQPAEGAGEVCDTSGEVERGGRRLLLGYTWYEAVMIAIAVTAAVLAGLYLGGFFN